MLRKRDCLFPGLPSTSCRIPDTRTAVVRHCTTSQGADEGPYKLVHGDQSKERNLQISSCTEVLVPAKQIRTEKSSEQAKGKRKKRKVRCGWILVSVAAISTDQKQLGEGKGVIWLTLTICEAAGSRTSIYPSCMS